MSQPEADQDAARRERSKRRRERMVGHRAKSFQEAERWDLEFWQQRSPQERLSALVAIHRDIEAIGAARRGSDKRADD